MTLDEFDELDLDSVLALQKKIEERDKRQTVRDAQLFSIVSNAPHYTKKDGAFSPADFLPETPEERKARAENKLARTLQNLKAMTANAANVDPAKSPEKKT